MKKRLLSMLLAASMVLSLISVPVMATEPEIQASGTCGENLTWTLTTDGTLTISGTGEMEDYSSSNARPWHSYQKDIVCVSLPEGLTSISYYAFGGCSNLESIKIPDGVEIIKGSAFAGCTSLTNIEVPASVTSCGDSVFSGCTWLESAGPIGSGCSYEFGWTESIPESAFHGCSGLTSVEIPSTVESIGPSAFAYCSALSTVIIPDAVRSIESNTFYQCSNLASVEIPFGVTRIGSYAFRGCGNLVGVEIPSGVTSVGPGAFYGCANLTSVEIPDGVTQLRPETFYKCSSLTRVEIPSHITDIGTYTFYGCSNLESVEIPSNVTILGAYLFYGCSNLTNISIPDGVTSIGPYAFYGCSNLNGVTIPSDVTSIGERAFYDCSSLSSVMLLGSKTSIGEYAFSGCTELETAGPIDSGCSYEFGWKSYIPANAFQGCSGLISVEIPDSVTSIGDNAFLNCSSLIEVDLPSKVTSIGYQAFFNCSSLITAEIPAGLTSLGSNAFNGCSSITSVKIPSGVTYISTNMFSRCSSLTSVELPNTLTNLGDSMFSDCSSLTNVTIPSTVTRIGYGVFRNCVSLKNIEIPDSVTYIGDSTFSGCSSLTSMKIPTGVQTIGSWLFSNCSKLADMQLPAGITSIGDYAFSGCSNLTDIIIPESVTSIGERAFQECSRLVSVNIPEGIKTILEYTFSGCSSLVDIEIPDSVTGIEEYAFSSCTSLSSLEIPASVFSIWDYAFANCSNLTDVYFHGDGPTVHWNSPFPAKTTLYYIEGTSGWTDNIYFNAAESTWHGNPLRIWDPNGELEVNFDGFNRYIYQAKSLDRTDSPAIANIHATLDQESMAAMFAKEAQKTGFDFSAGAWKFCNNISDLYDDPTSAVDLMAEPKNIYTAVIMNVLEAKLEEEINVINNEYSIIMRAMSSYVSTVNEAMRTAYSVDIADRYNYNSLNEEQKAFLRDLTKKFFKAEIPEWVEMEEVFSGVILGLDIVGSIQDYYSRVVSCMMLANMSESMKQAVIQAYENSLDCGNSDLRNAMKDCVDIITSSQEELILQLVQDGATVVGKRSLSFLVKELFWKDIKASITYSLPGVAVVQAAFKVGKLISNMLGNTDKLVEQNTKIEVVSEVEKLFDSAAESTKEKFKYDETEKKAQTYLSSIDLSFGIRQAGCDEVGLLIEAVDSSVINNIFGKDYSDQLDAVNTIKGVLKTEQAMVDWAWIEMLPEDYPDTGLYEYYSALQEEEWNRQLAKAYSIHCPVDVYVYDQQDNLVAYVEGERVSTTVDDITVIRIGDQKELWFDDDSKYRIEYVGTDSGDMDITVQEYDGNEEVTRTVSFFDVPLENQQQYDMYVETVAESDDIYHLLTDTETEVVEDYDSLTEDTSRHTLTVNSGVLVRENGPEKEASVGENELVSLIAYVPEGFRFLGWEASDHDAVFTDPMQLNTEVRMTDCDLTVWPVMEAAEGGGFVLNLQQGTEDTIAAQLSNGNTEAKDVIYVLTAYNEVGRLIGMKMTAQQLDARESIELSVKPSSVEEVAQVKAMVLDKETYAPLREAWVREF